MSRSSLPTRLSVQSWLSILLFSFTILLACGEAEDRKDTDSPKTDGQEAGVDDETDGDTDDATDSTDDTEEEKPVTFTTPVKEADAAIDGSYIFKLAFAEQPEGTTWSLYWSKEAGDTENGTVILADQATTVTEYEWAMGGLDQGEYFFYVTLNFANGGITVHQAPGSVQYTEKDATSNVSPQITSLSDSIATGTALIATSDTAAEIEYSIFDADGDTPTVKIELSSDGGVTYDIVLSENAPVDGYTWNVPDSEVPPGVYHFRLTADDGESIAAEETSATPIVVYDGTTYTYDDHVQTILADNCNSCHGTGQQNVAVFKSDAYAPGVGAGDWSDNIVRTAVNFETMPKNLDPLPAAQQLILKAWFLQGAAEN